MTVLRRCFAIPRLLHRSQPQPSASSSTRHLFHSPAASTPTTLLSTTHRLSLSHSAPLSAATAAHRCFHCAAAYNPPHLHRHHPTHLSSPTSSTLTSSPLSSVVVRQFRKGRKGPRAKLKSHSGSKKRFRFTRTGVIMRWRAGKSHKNVNKSGARLRRLSKPVEVYHGHVKMIRRSLPYGMRHSR